MLKENGLPRTQCVVRRYWDPYRVADSEKGSRGCLVLRTGDDLPAACVFQMEDLFAKINFRTCQLKIWVIQCGNVRSARADS
jgi:hypothetical protein